MKNFINLVFLSTVVWGLSYSCTDVLTVNDEDQTIVLNALLYNTATISGTISYSTSVNESGYDKYIDNAEIEVYENDELIGIIYSKEGNYSMPDFYPQASNYYSLQTIIDGNTLIAETSIPTKTQIISVDTATTLNEDNEKQLSYSLLLNDEEGDDYYRLAVTKEIITKNKSGSKTTTTTKVRNLKPDTDDDIFASLLDNFGGIELDFGPENEFRIFSDDDFKNEQIKIQFSTPVFSDTISNIVSETYHIYLQKLSPEFFDYLKSITLYIYYNEMPFSEPVDIYTNVANGKGIFGGFNDEAVVSFQKLFNSYSEKDIK